MLYTRRDVGRMALATGFASNLIGAAKPDSRIKEVQIGAITYSFRSMPDQSAEATLQYCVDSGISGIELMGGPVNDWARKQGKWDSSPAAAAAAAVASARGGMGMRGGSRGSAPTYPVVAGMQVGFGNNQPSGQWNGKACPEARGGAPGGGGRGRVTQTPEQIAAAEAERKWRLALPMSIFTSLRKMYNDASVTIYAVKDVRETTDEDLDYTFTVATALGATHVTAELPTTHDPETLARLKRLGDFALKHKMFFAYHSHAQGGMDAFDDAFAASKGNMANIDVGHMVTNPNAGGTPLDFLNKFHGRISSIHLKDRTKEEHCTLNLPWGTGETPIKEILQLMSKNKWQFPASIELEYSIPEGSDAVKEVAKCLAYCRKVLA